MLKFTKSNSYINEADALQSHNVYTDMRGAHSAEDDHAQLILFFVELQIEAFIGVGEACHIEILKKYGRCQGSYCVVASQ